ATMSMGIGGAETHIIELCRALKKAGEEPTVISAGGELLPELERSGIPHLTAPLDKKDPVSLARSERRLRRAIRDGGFSVVHAHARIPAFLCGRLQREFGFVFLTSAHYDFKVTPLLRKLTDWGEHTFAVSDDIRRYLLREYGVGEEHVTVTVNGIDTERFSPGEAPETVKKEMESGGQTILHVSRLEPYSAVLAHRLIEAAGTLCADRDVTVCLLGDGTERPKLEKEAAAVNKKLGKDAVRLLGARPDVRDHLRACDVFIGPSRAALEAMACGKPLVLGGSEGYLGVFDGTTEERALATNLCCRGERLPDAAEIARDLATLLDVSEDERRRIGERNRAFVCERYSTDRMVRDHLAVYRALSPHAGKKTHYDAVLCGYFGYGNMGDAAVRCALTRGLRRRKPDASLCVLTATPEKTARQYGVDACYRFDLAGISRILKRSSVLVFGGGNLLQDSTSNASLWYYLHILSRAKVCKAKIAVYANGIGPVQDDRHLVKIGETLAMADSVSLRERHSFELVKALCPDKENVRLTFDPALLTEKSGKREIALRHGLLPLSYFVISPRAIDRFSEKKLVDTAREMTAQYGLTPVLVPMQRGEDEPVCRALSEKLPGSIVLEENFDFTGILDLLDDAAFVISARLHTLIYATSAACPMIGFSDDIKLSAYLSYIGVEEAAGRSLSAGITTPTDTLIAMADTAMAKRGEIRSLLTSSLPIWRTMAEYEFAEILK
ncbi:MAG: polysaccharide pyruvyl transferase CsaB, partial [Ruminococcus sp.]|nr:polysaccharide pyruvyl transferase CsaB [Candidatus Apopatosoma intestinale]